MNKGLQEDYGHGHGRGWEIGILHAPVSVDTSFFKYLFSFMARSASICVHVWNKKLKVSSGEVLISALQQQMGTNEIKLNDTKNCVIYN
jgi:hypothetical protein